MNRLEILPHDALIIVDVQNDFLPNGALAVPNGDRVIPVLNKMIDDFKKANSPVFATRDWHPVDHCSFKEQGGPWPPHCVQNSYGAEFSKDLHLPKDAILISKADNPQQEAYSNFSGTDLSEKLAKLGIKRIIVGGLATDYCVKETVLDARKIGLEVVVIENGIEAVNVHTSDDKKAIQSMQDAGAIFVSI
jgi:nicotinamidase/pyrazinamidase